MARTLLLVATRKGAWLLPWRPRRGGPGGSTGRDFLGHVLNHLVLDPRDRAHAAGGGEDRSPRPDRLPLPRPRPDLEGGGSAARVPEGPTAAGAVDHTFWLTPGHAARARAPGTPGPRPRASSAPTTAASPGTRLVGSTTTRGTGRWMGGGAGRHARRAEAPLDPGRPARSRATSTSAMSSGGVHQSPRPGPRRWTPLLKRARGRGGTSMRPTPTFHDPHCVQLCPRPTRTASTSRTTAASTASTGPRSEWVRIGKEHAEADRATSASRWCVHPRDADTAWVFPMDGTTVWPRTSPGGKPSVHVTRDAGRTWKRLDPRPSRARRRGGRSSGRP